VSFDAVVPLSARALLMIVHSYGADDPRVRREAEAAAERGDVVDVICLRAPGQRARRTIRGVTYWSLPLRRRRGGPARYVFEYAALFLGAALLSIPLHLVRRYRVVQAHNMPDVLVLAGVVPWLTGASTLLDLHDPVPELYQAKFGLAPSSPWIRMLTWMEGASIACADHVLVATGAFRDRLLARGRPGARIDVLLNVPDPRLFARPGAEKERELRTSAGDPALPLRALFHGTITHRSGVDLAIEAIERVRARGIDLRLEILGDGDFLPEVRAARERDGRAAWIELRDAVPIERVPDAVAACDLGVIPNRPGPFHDLALPTRLFESLAVGRPVVVAKSAAIRALFPEGDLLEFEPGDVDDFARVLEHACRDPSVRARCVERGGAIVRRHAWEREKETYLRVLDELFECSNGFRAHER
jgi:glycosyltransferase involved in cell wall biosynthesis